jgi:hypothetical protein
VALVALAGALVLAGCTSSAPTTTVSTSAASAASSAPVSSPPPAAAPAYNASATNAEALAAFTAVVKKLLVTDPQPHGRDVIDALVAAGFDKKAMELTPDDTTIGRNVDSIEFSVLWKAKDCLLGQVGSAGFSSSSAPVLSTGKCLIGTTRAIDW